MAIFLFSMALAAAAGAAEIPAAQTSCPVTPAALPAELSAWSASKPLEAAKNSETAMGMMLQVGQATDLALSPMPEVSYGVRPTRPGGSVSNGGMATFTIAKSGTYRVAIDSAAWVDVVADGKTLESVGHGHGPDCSGIRKIVDFKLAPGNYLLQIAGNATPKVRVLVTSSVR